MDTFFRIMEWQIVATAVELEILIELDAAVLKHVDLKHGG